ncbi:hypothetical protein SESBI_43990 [Sesbania bispinosa]|nr:hypothetical protein SESBI_43990 [Sesbania bispinosa]
MEGQLRSPMPDQPMVNEDENVSWVRDDIPGMTVDTCVVDHQVTREESQH